VSNVQTGTAHNVFIKKVNFSDTVCNWSLSCNVFKGIVQRKLSWVEIGVNRQVFL
jgi:hypothetical protein